MVCRQLKQWILNLFVHSFLFPFFSFFFDLFDVIRKRKPGFHRSDTSIRVVQTLRNKHKNEKPFFLCESNAFSNRRTCGAENWTMTKRNILVGYPERSEFFDTERQNLPVELFRCVGKILHKSNCLLSKENCFQLRSKQFYTTR